MAIGQRNAAFRDAAFLILALALSIVGQRLLLGRQFILDGILLIAAGLGIFLWAGRKMAPPLVELGRNNATWPSFTSKEKGRRSRLAWSLAGMGALALAFLSFGGNSFNPLGILLWLGGLALLLYAFWEPMGPVSWPGFRRNLGSFFTSKGLRLHLSWTALALAGALLLAVFFSFYQLEVVPGEMTSDHAEKILDIQDILEGRHPIFFPRNIGREPLQFYVTAAYVYVTGVPLNHLALKVPTALFSVLTVAMVYLLAREVTDEKLALIATLFVAISKWHVATSRVGLRFPLAPLMVAVTLYFTVRALKYGQRKDYVFAGLSLGTGLYGYTAFRVVPFLVVGLLGTELLVRFFTSEEKGQFANLVLTGLFSLAVFIPLGRYMMDSPRMFWYRVLTRVSSLERPVNQDPALVLKDTLVATALMFNWRGDVVWVNNVPGDPSLDYVTGALFLLGLGYLTVQAARNGRLAVYLLVSLLALLLPSALSLAFPGESPSVARASGAIPVVFIIAAFPLYLAAEKLKVALGSWAGPLAATACILVLLLAAGKLNYDRYFRDYAEQYRRSSWNSTEMARVIQGFAETMGDVHHAYIKSWPHWVDTRNVGINLGLPRWDNALAEITDDFKERDNATNKLVIVNPQDTLTMARLAQLYPNGQARMYPSATPGKGFWIFLAPAGR
ncbi:MAG: glycosyltransferase family 39 protein [Chloroflexi bacterium]|nr:glycosyltransferase family 39 protein [Chloroflexota bacterium]